LGSAVDGRKVFFAFRGHGASTPPTGAWNYAELAADLRDVADAHGATRALGVSMGAGALCRLLAGDPGRFERLVFFLPAVLDTPRLAPARERLAALASAVESGSADVLADVVTQEVPPAAAGTAAARVYVRQRVAALQGHSAVATALRSLPDLTALDDASALRAVRAPALVLGCHGDPQHPAEVAERLAELLPSASLHVYDEPGILWTARADLRARIAGFLNH
jgi:3-oxoadipate enol-lactonase